MIDSIVNVVFVVSFIPLFYSYHFMANEKDERGQLITSKSFQMTYSFVVIGIVILFIFNSSIVSFVTINYETFRLLIIMILLIGNFVLGITIFVLNKLN